jgi:lysophospholipase L1-like esterase
MKVIVITDNSLHSLQPSTTKMKRRTFIRNAISPALLSVPAISSRTHDTEGPIEVINAGIGGDNTVDLLARIEKDCLERLPGLTVLKIGTNDMNSRKYVPLRDYENNLKTIVRKIIGVKSALVLMNLLPVYEPYLFNRHKPEFYLPEGHRGRLDEMNECIGKLATEFRLSVIDLHHLFAKAGNVGLEATSWIKNEANSNTSDGLHPTPEGYRMIAVAVYQHIHFNKLITGKIVCLGDSITRGDGSLDKESYPAWLKKLLN